MAKYLTIKGEQYKVRYYSRTSEGKAVVVLDTDRLQGTFGDEWPVVQTKDGWKPVDLG